MKKLLLLLTCIWILSGCTQTTSTNRIQTNKETAGIHEITYNELQDKLHSEDAFILYIGRPDCGDCKEFYPILEDYIASHEGTSVYYLNVKAFRDASRQEGASKEEIAFFENIKEELDFTWTPTLKYVSKGIFKDTYTYLSEEYYKIKDESKKEIKKEEFKEEFIAWMDAKFE